MIAQTLRLSAFQLDVIRGSLLGDGSLGVTKRLASSKGVKFRLGHGIEQTEYLDWKVSLFANIRGSYWVDQGRAAFWDSTPLPELNELRREIYRNGQKEFSDSYLETLSPLALALWYMDDGGFDLRGEHQDRGRISICVEAMTPSTRERVVAYLRRRHGIETHLAEVNDKAIIRFDQPATERLHELIAEHVHPSMSRKLLPKWRGRFHVEPVFSEPRRELLPAKIASIEPKPAAYGGRRWYRYDIEVDGTHNYLVDGVVVHNSPETTSGGRALKFYASVRIDIRPIEPIKQGDVVIGRRVKVKVVKNKVAPPFRIAEIEILANEGISREGGLLDMGITTGVLDKSGAWINYGKMRIGQGRENAKQFLREHADVAAEIDAKVRAGTVTVGNESPNGEEG